MPTIGSIMRVACRLVVAMLLPFAAVDCSSSSTLRGNPTAATSTGSPAGTTPETDELTPTGTITLTDEGCTIDGIESPLPDGPIAVTLINETGREAVANFSMIFPSRMYEQLADHIAREIRLAEKGQPGLGHPDYAPPAFDLFLDAGETGVLRGELSRGTWAIVCGRTYDEVGEVRPSGVFGPYEVEKGSA
jgi:hypothetical protein